MNESDEKNLFEKNITRRKALKIAGTAALMGLIGPIIPEALAAAEKKPNILFILTDDHRYDAFSCMGHPVVKTPNLDRIANEGANFKNAFVTTSLCSPSRASFLTGQYAHTHGVVTNHTMWDDNNVTFMELIKKAGYDTAFIGKWHMPGDKLPNLRGVDEFITFTKEGGQGVYYDCPLIINGVETPRPGKYITDDLTDFAIKFIEKKKRNPFCLYLSHKAAHFGFRPPQHMRTLYKGQDLHMPPESDTWVTLTNNNIFVGAPLPMNNLYRNYLRVITSVDEQVGRLLNTLERMGELDDTVIIYAGDNGHLFGERGLYDKRNAYEESIRIPFFIRYPKLTRQAGKRDQMILNIDLAPTLLDIIGARIPSTMQGESIVPYLKSPLLEGRDAFLYEHFPVFPIPIPGIAAVRTKHYKYIEYQKGTWDDQLFDLKNDPRELKNIIKTDAGRLVLPALKDRLENLKRETGYRFFTRG
ncbi:MAG TPA: sulfatase [Smithellaceae bacterium]|nr:sulfatase [Smithellaceae bacterium]HRS89941.1 sulfatase [Smithellaceae bacterium]HRV26778.1 sulfatase [Smithellaceae bacterium]